MSFKVWYIHTVEYHSDRRRIDVLIALGWLSFEDMLSAGSWIRKATHGVPRTGKSRERVGASVARESGGKGLPTTLR